MSQASLRAPRRSEEAAFYRMRHLEKPPDLAVFPATGFRVCDFPVKLGGGPGAGRAPWTF
jgi:hypothetical protein